MYFCVCGARALFRVLETNNSIFYSCSTEGISSLTRVNECNAFCSLLVVPRCQVYRYDCASDKIDSSMRFS